MSNPIPTDICSFDNHKGQLLMAIARTKENPDIDSEITFREFAKNELTLKRKYNKLATLANNYRNDITWRIYISANARDAKKAHWNFLERIQDLHYQASYGHSEPKYKQTGSYWYSELQKPESSAESRFIIDIDGTFIDYYTMNRLLEEHIIYTTRTPNGWHILTEPFNYTKMETNADYELKTDGLLFIEKIES